MNVDSPEFGALVSEWREKDMLPATWVEQGLIRLAEAHPALLAGAGAVAIAALVGVALGLDPQPDAMIEAKPAQPASVTPALP